MMENCIQVGGVTTRCMEGDETNLAMVSVFWCIIRMGIELMPWRVKELINKESMHQ